MGVEGFVEQVLGSKTSQHTPTATACVKAPTTICVAS